jgi:hypothetical protein
MLIYTTTSPRYNLFMGILISLIVLPIQEIHERRKKKKAEKIARNYTTTDATPSTQSQSRRPDTQQQPELVSATQPPPKPIPGQQQQRVEEFDPTLGAARAGYPAPV